MSKVFDISVYDKEVQEALSMLSKSGIQKCVKQAAKMEMAYMRTIASQEAPVDHSAARDRKAKHLKDSIVLSRAKSGSEAFVGGVQTASRAALGIKPGDPYYWPAANLFGFRRKGEGVYAKHHDRMTLNGKVVKDKVWYSRRSRYETSFSGKIYEGSWWAHKAKNKMQAGALQRMNHWIMKQIDFVLQSETRARRYGAI